MLRKLLQMLEARCKTILNDMHTLIAEVCDRGNVELRHLISLAIEVYVKARSCERERRFLGRKRVRKVK